MKMKHRSSFLFLDNRLADDHCPYVFAEGWFVDANNQVSFFPLILLGSATYALAAGFL